MFARLLLIAAVLVGCSDAPAGDSDAGADSAPVDDAGDGGDADEGVAPGMACASTLPRLRPVDAASAARGAAWLQEDVLGRGIVPRLGLENLWLVWGSGRLTGEAYWAAFGERYGFSAAPFENGGLPMGVRDAGGGLLTFDCLGCHAGEVAGTPVIGAANSLVDFETLYDDLVALNALAPQFGYPQLPIPFELDGFTGAAGASDAFGLAMKSSLAHAGGVDPGIHTTYGFQRSPAWWTLAYKQRIYTDGAGVVDGHRTMMATLLAFGTPLSELQAMDAAFDDVAEYLRSLEPPCWTLSELDAAAVERGRAVFDDTCASCHGVHSGAQAAFPDRVVALDEVGTDPLRAAHWGEAEAAWVNASWFGSPPMTATGGYLAQPLVGIWARAPYFHNGSVPDLAAVLDPAQRPPRWRRTGSGAQDYDAERVGWRYETVDAPPPPDTRAGRAVVDTTRPGLSAAGHTWGSELDAAARADLLEYLRSL